MDRLDKAIADVAYVLDTLIAYRNIRKAGKTCNECGVKNICELVPKPGELVRMNCPLWVEESDDNE